MYLEWRGNWPGRQKEQMTRSMGEKQRSVSGRSKALECPVGGSPGKEGWATKERKVMSLRKAT